MYVELISYTPNPDEVCAIAAHNCVSESVPTDGDVKHLTHALRSGHTSVAENAVFTFSISGVSRVVETQLVRHRIGCSYAIQSGRYCNREPTNYVRPFTPDKENTWNALDEYDRALKNLDEALKDENVSKEDRRYIYPQGLKTNIVVTMSGRALLHFFALRCCAKAQTEIRELADKMLELVKPVAPTIFENAGPSCVQAGYCPEGKRSCGRAMTLGRMLDIVDEQKTAERECH